MKLSTSGLISCIYIFLLSFFASFSFAGQPPAGSLVVAQQAAGANKPGLEQNMGQFRNMNGVPVPFVLFRLATNNMQVYVTNKGITYAFNKIVKDDNSSPGDSLTQNMSLHLYRIDADLEGAVIQKENIELLEQNGTAHKNYFYPTCPAGIYNVHEYKKIRIREIYPGINWVLYVNDKGLKYDFEIGPGADPDLIKIIYRGAKNIELKKDGSVTVKGMLGSITELEPVSYQENIPVGTQFVLSNDSIISFKLAAHNPFSPITIDPQLVWGTLVGNADVDEFKSIKSDNKNNLFVTGFTKSLGFPTVGAGTYYDNAYGSSADIVLLKFNSKYNLVWSTFYGGTNSGTSEINESGTAISVLNTGDILVTGFTNSTNFPCLDGGGNYFNGTAAGGFDGFLLKFKNDGTRLFATYIGGAGNDFGYDIAFNNSSEFFLCGKTFSNNFPIMAGSGYNSNAANGSTDGFIMKFSLPGALLWSTYFGGSASDVCNSICVDNSGNLFVTGTTSSSNFPLQDNGTYFDNTYGVNPDAFISKFDNTLNLKWSTYYGGTSAEYGLANAIDRDDNVIVFGQTSSNTFPTFSSGTGYFDGIINDSPNNSSTDAFILKFSNNGTRLYATYFGGKFGEANSSQVGSYIGDVDYNDMVVTDPCGNYYIGFLCYSPDVVTVNPGCTSYYDDTKLGDCFITKFSSSNELKWATCVGGKSGEYGLSLAFDNNYNLLAAGVTVDDFGFPFTEYGNAYYDNTNAGYDAFLLKFDQPSLDMGVNYSLCAGPCSGNAEVIFNTPCPSSYSYKWSDGSTTKVVNNLCEGEYSVTITDLNSCASDSDRFTMSTGIKIYPVVTPYSCNFACTGTATVKLQGQNNLTYLWSNGRTTASITALCPDDYSVTVTIPSCGTASANFAVSLPPPLKILLKSLNQPASSNCVGACNGSAWVVVQGGQTGSNVTWSNEGTGTSQDSLCTDVKYIVTAADSSCYSTSIDFTTQKPPKFSISAGASFVCFTCDGTASVTPLNSSGELSYKWSTGDTLKRIDSLCPGTYSVTVIDAKCGVAVANFNVGTTAPVTITGFTKTGPFCGCDGTALVKLSYEYASPTYQWSNGQSTQKATGLCADSTYYVTILDDCGHTDVDSVKLTTQQISIILNSAPSCPGGLCTGSLSVSISGGTSPYTYNWSNGQTANGSKNLCYDSTYSVTVTDACLHTATKSVKINTYNALNISIRPLLFSCPGTCDGIAAVIISNTTGIPKPPYTFQWSNGSTDSIVHDLCPGTVYTVTVSTTCATSYSSSLSFPQASKVHIDMGKAPSCWLTCNGTAYGYVVGGIPPMNYIWNNGASESLITNVCADSTYYVTVTDACNTQDSGSVTIPLTTPLVNQITYPQHGCIDTCVASANVISVGGSPPFIYKWSTGSVTDRAAALCTDSVNTLVVLDPGCTIDTLDFIIPHWNLAVSITDSADNNCSFACSGRATVNVSGAPPPYYYKWNTNDTLSTITGLCPGNYNVSVSGCGLGAAATHIGGLTLANVTVTPLDSLKCGNNCMGIAKATTSGGSSSFQFHWSNGQTGTTATNLCGSNQKLIINETGCPPDTVAFNFKVIPFNFALNSNQTDVSCNGSCNGTAGISVIAGKAPFTYTWYNGKTTSGINGLCPGQHTVIVRDSAGCIKHDTITINQPQSLEFNSLITSSHCINADGKATTFGNGGSAPYRFHWSNGATTDTISGLAEGIYWCTITDDSNCTVIDSVSVFGHWPQLNITSDTVILIGNQAYLYAAGVDFYQWSPANNIDCPTCATTHASPTVTTTYCVLGTDLYGCPDSACMRVTVSNDCGDINLPDIFSPNHDGLNDIFHVLGKCVTDVHMTIYNRWGEKIFESRNKDIGWDGSYKGEEAEIGSYAYKVEANNIVGIKMLKQGFVVLVR